MAVSDSMVLMALTVLLILWVMKDYPFWQGILLMLTGITTFLWLSANNPYGWIIMALGFIVTLSSDWDTNMNNTVEYGRRESR